MTPTPVATPTSTTVGGVDVGVVINLLGFLLNAIVFFYIVSRGKKGDDKLIWDELRTLGEDVAVLKSKVGLFYGSVEELIPKMLSGGFNPIELSPTEQEAYGEYTVHKSKTRTEHLRLLENALDRELHERTDIPSDEFLAAWLMLQAIKAQLVDRREHVVKTEYNNDGTDHE
jgi:hypothetical protein